MSFQKDEFARAASVGKSNFATNCVYLFQLPGLHRSQHSAALPLKERNIPELLSLILFQKSVFTFQRNYVVLALSTYY